MRRNFSKLSVNFFLSFKNSLRFIHFVFIKFTMVFFRGFIEKCIFFNRNYELLWDYDTVAHARNRSLNHKYSQIIPLDYDESVTMMEIIVLSAWKQLCRMQCHTNFLEKLFFPVKLVACAYSALFLSLSLFCTAKKITFLMKMSWFFLLFLSMWLNYRFHWLVQFLIVCMLYGVFSLFL